ncbi:FG-GAP repeat-containing protein [Nannocystis exedens]|uniref:FG-GAP repeat-containing protein n=1 Tax=Nannocystis exedens TaxID=54 RepID=A0A1I2A027_9BACT|nr:VCBS repeat-containing protein [Nannocystis exedens]PCC75269.1 FG-GAP repeat protein [Nannocystis exedens]SFE36080.1 FG-GAP repeat-containing protein [Nannocystis exedens]
MRAHLASALALLLVGCTDRPLGETDGDSGAGGGGGTEGFTGGGPGGEGTGGPGGEGTGGLTSLDPTEDPTGDPTDGPGGDLSPAIEPYSLEVADFDGDGHDDLLVMGLDDAELIAGWVARGHGDGSFTADLAPTLKGASAYPAIGQLDGDAGVDVMVAQFADAARIFRWQVAEFAAYKTLKSPPTPRNHVVADIDRDGRNDVVALCHGAHKFGLTVHRGSDAAAWTTTTTVLGAVADFAPANLLVGQLDGDGVPDALLFEADAPRGFLRVLGRPGGEFVEPEVQVGHVRPWSAALGDLDEDGALDILAAEHFPTRLSLATGDGAGGFTHAGAIAIDPPFTPHALDIDDLDGDGHLDVVAVDALSPILLYWTGHGDGAFEPAQALQLPSGAVRVHAARLDPGPALDLAVATFDAGAVTVLLNPVAP